MHELFQVHMLTEDGKKKAVEMASEFNALVVKLEEMCGKDGREMALVRTKLEEACFFAKKAMAKLNGTPMP